MRCAKWGKCPTPQQKNPAKTTEALRQMAQMRHAGRKSSTRTTRPVAEIRRPPSPALRRPDTDLPAWTIWYLAARPKDFAAWRFLFPLPGPALPWDAERGAAGFRICPPGQFLISSTMRTRGLRHLLDFLACCVFESVHAFTLCRRLDRPSTTRPTGPHLAANPPGIVGMSLTY